MRYVLILTLLNLNAVTSVGPFHTKAACERGGRDWIAQVRTLADEPWPTPLKARWLCIRIDDDTE